MSAMRGAAQPGCSNAAATAAADERAAAASASRPRSRVLELLGVLFVCAANVIIFVRTPKGGTLETAYQAAAVAPSLLVLAAVLCLPARVYGRLRQVLVPVLCLGYHAQPSERLATASVARLMLSGAPCPGALWAAVDALRTLMGLRLVPNAIITLVFELPLPLAAAVHVAVIALTAADNDAYCAMPLLAHPLTQARMQRVAAAMHVSTTFATPLGTSIARPSAQYACTDVVQFCQVAFAVVPLVLLSWVEHVKGGAGGVARPAAELRAVQQHAGPPHQARLLLVLAKRAWHAAPRSVYLACGCGLSWPQRAALLAWLLSMLWLLTTF